MQIALYDPQGGGEEQLRQRKFPEIPPPWGAVVPAMQHAARQHKQATVSVERPVKAPAMMPCERTCDYVCVLTFLQIYICVLTSFLQ